VNRICWATVLLFFVSPVVRGGNTGFIEEYRNLRLMIGRQEFSQAIDVCRAMINRYPASIPLYETLAEVGLYSERLDEVDRFFEERIETGEKPVYAYFGIGLVHYDRRDYRTAVLCFDRAISLGLAAPECYRMLEYAYEKTSGEDAAIRFFTLLCHRDPDNANHWYGLALAYWDKKDPSKIFRYLDNALERSPDEQVYLQARAAATSLLGDENSALKLMIGVLSRSLEEADYQGFFFVQAHLVQMQVMLGKPVTNAPALYTLTNTATKFGYYRWQGWGYLKESDSYFFRADFVRSDSVVQRAYNSSLTSHDANLTSAVLVRAVENSLALGKLFDALDYCLQRASTAQRDHNDLEYLLSLTDLARVYNEMGKFKLALECASEVLSLSEGFANNTNLTIRLRDALGGAYRGLAKYDDAISNFQLVIQSIPPMGVWNYLHSDVAGEMGQCFLLMGRLVEARKSFRVQSLLARRLNAPALIASSLANKGDLDILTGKYTTAQYYYRQALTLAEQHGYVDVIEKCLWGLARVAENTGDLRLSVTMMSRLLASPKERELELLQDIPTYGARDIERKRCEFFLKILLKLKDFRQAFLVAEREKLRNFRDLFTFRLDHDELTSNKPEHLSMMDSLIQTRHEIANLYLKMTDPGGHNPFTQNIPGFARPRNELARKEILYLKILDSLKERDSKFRKMLFPPVESLDAIQQRLAKEKETVVEYFVGEQTCTLIVITPDTVHAISLSIGRNALAQLLTKCSPAIGVFETSEPVLNAVLADFRPESSRELYSLLLSPVRELLKPYKKLLVVADDILRNLPFEILCTSFNKVKGANATAQVQCLLQELEVRYAPTATRCVRLASTPPARLLLLLGEDSPAKDPRTGRGTQLANSVNGENRVQVGDLGGVRNEIDRIRTVCPSATSLMNGRSIKRSGFLKNATEFRVIHIASHANLDPQYPLASSVVIAPQSDSLEDALLRAYDLAELNLRADLVVLSGCNTVRWSNSAQNYGFIRALMNGGSASVIGSLWQVDDETTAELMQRVYVHLFNGKTYADALRQAKIDLFQSGKRDPYFWGSFILFGESLTIELRDNGSNFPNLVPLALIGLTVGGIVLLTLRSLLRRGHFKKRELG
jgi:CHAT domain-containing protein/tetratricopeptide (TPR) repeat protein